MIKFKPLLLASLAALVVSSQSVQAQNYPYYSYGQQYASPYANPYQNYNAYNPYYNGNYYNGRPFNNGYYPNRSFNNRPSNNNFFNKGPFGGNNMPFTGNSNFAEDFWPGRGSIYEDIAPVDGPWNRNWGRAPWNRDYDDLWEPEGGPDKWFDMSDPKEGMAWAWEDMMVTPNALGTMPGGWEAPSIVIPNPIDVGDEFKNASGDMPGEMRDFSEGFTYGDSGANSDNYNSNRGIGFGNKKKKKGINIQPKTYRR